MANVSIDQVTKRFGAVTALDAVSVDIAAGEFVALVGPSGCGKSTLLRLIAGLDDISGGEIRIGSQVVNELTPQERNIAMVFQNYALYPHMTVRDNMGFGLKMRGMTPDSIRSAVDRAAGILGLQTMLDRLPGQLSGGQRQRVAMGRAIVRDSSVFLFDEPLSNLDAQLRVQMRSEIKELHQRLGNTMVYVTHDQIEAMTMADRIVVMRDGKIEQVGAPIELYDRPANRFVASFIGSPAMNMIPGQVNSGATPSVSLGRGATLPLEPNVAVDARRDVVVGFRPEAVRLVDGGIPSRVRLVEPTGSETHLLLDFESHSVLSAQRERHAVRPGESLAWNVAPRDIHLFDAATGVRL